MTESCELVAGRTARTQRVLRIVHEPFERARDICSRLIGAGEIAIHVVDAPDECIPEWGLGGSTYGPHSIVLAVDPDHDIRASHVYSTLVHEIHHAMRWRDPGCATTLGERLVSEGLAQAYEHECTGSVPLYAQGDISPQHRALALGALDEDPADEGRWFFGTADLPRWFGYRLGYHLVRSRIDTLGSNAARMVHEPAQTFLHGLAP